MSATPPAGFPQLLPVHQDNTVAARVGRRRDFRRMFAPPTAYVPQPYENTLVDEPDPDPEPRGDDLTGQLLAVIDRATNAERAGDVLPDPL